MGEGDIGDPLVDHTVSARGRPDLRQRSPSWPALSTELTFRASSALNYLRPINNRAGPTSNNTESVWTLELAIALRVWASPAPYAVLLRPEAQLLNDTADRPNHISRESVPVLDESPRSRGLRPDLELEVYQWLLRLRGYESQ